MQKTYKTEAIVIKRKNISEADKIVTVFTPQLGKLVLIAKGIRRIRSRRAPHLELFNRVSLIITKGRTWDIIIEAQTQEIFPELRGDLPGIAYAYRVAEYTDQLCPEHQAHPMVYRALAQVLHTLSAEDSGTVADEIDQFTLFILRELGYLPPQQQVPRLQLRRLVESIMERSSHSDRLLDKLLDK